VFARSEDYAIESTYEDDMLIEQLVSYRQQKKAAEAAIRKLENQIKARMETAEELHSPIALVSWKSQTQRRISEKRLKELYPEIDVNAIRETVEMRRFTVREEEEEE
jgi:predicted phage-related endonuclease